MALNQEKVGLEKTRAKTVTKGDCNLDEKSVNKSLTFVL